MSPMDGRMEKPHKMMVLLTRRLRLRLSREVIMSSPKRETWGCHGIAVWFTQANTSVG